MNDKHIEQFFRLLGRMPKTWGERLGKTLGRLAFIADARHRNIALQNLSDAFNMPRAECKPLAVKVFENLGKIVFEMAWSLRLDEENLFTYFKIEGLSHIWDACEKNRGVLALTAHFGNWELLTIIAAMVSYPLNVVYRPLDFKSMDQFIARFRTRFGAKLIPKKKSMRMVLRCLERREIVALLMDQNVSWREGVFMPFFGHRACTNKGMALLALKTGAPVIPVFLVREENGFKAVFLPEIPLIKTGDKTKDVEANTQQYNDVIESVVRQYPDQWFWVHQRWKTKAFQPWPRKLN